MRFVRLILISALAMLWAGVASAQPHAVQFSLIGTTTACPACSFPSVSTITPLPVVGSGVIDETNGTYNLTLPSFSIDIDITGPPGTPGQNDARLDTTGWGQNGTFAGGVGGAMTTSSTTGGTSCFPYPLSPIGTAICATYPAYPGTLPVVAWPPTGAAGPLGPAGATINLATNTIVVTEPWNSVNGQVQNTYTYTPGHAIPTLSEWGMMAFGLMLLLTAMIVTIRRREQLPTA